ncbi:MAG: oligoendopeptidase F [Candidatus Omnitrophica bacterium CG11_big_fil_rev_8_21_14_0_20_45_26]|uniref:Oligoendopeptidase F n=1 Tax=Candidatus Abzuiibacterium crystallinum TaxID=1974748 RepID=A0A2H0LR55_9BACT|nr:MAG: oligoendopeptidase F [Candidatus Omnitrophica bacterium CG11_big_fil_rev_8_21_14_0_20_45_26]PIW65760.1 MAG: oligoendopeptidase F [Candidatus Omnitrophica bacterium CG12_big_fil_rev_8_21_14_0_65_45_16]
MQKKLAKGIRWNLNDLYSGTDDPRIEKDLAMAETLALEFEKKCRPFFHDTAPLTAGQIAGLLSAYKEIVTCLTRPGCFAQLVFAEQTNRPGIGAFIQKIRVRITEIENHILFWDVEWNRLDDAKVETLVNDPLLQKDRHYLLKLRAYRPFTLAEKEEKIMSMKANTSSSAFSRLFDEVVNQIPFYVTKGKQRVKKTEGEILALLHSANRPERKMAARSLAEGLEKETHLLAYIFNMILADRRTSLQIRGYAHPMDPMNLANEITLPMVRHLVTSVKRAYPLAQRYYRLKKKLLGLRELYDYDRYAPAGKDRTQIPFRDCQKITVEGYRDFSPDAARIVEQFFTQRWIDAEIRDGKQGGGFCMETTPDLHPYILVNYTGSIRDVMTVAHECGHGLHQYLARQAGILESHAPLTLAETASVFGEMIIFEKLLKDEKSARKKLALLCGKIDDNFATVFRQIVLTDFELKTHEAGLKDGELSSERVSDLWIEANRELYGQSVKLTPEYRHGWKYIPHFIHSPFYCYAYSFAQLFVLTLFQKYKTNPSSFVPRYFEMLSLGGSRRPEALAELMGLDLQDPNFWQSGIQILEDLVVQAENLYQK